MKSIKDLIYFDFEKARSLISQLKGGLVSEISKALETDLESEANLGFDIKVVKGSVGEKGVNKSISSEKIELYHELLNKVQKELTTYGTLNNLNESFHMFKGSFNDYMEMIPSLSFIIAEGWSQFEDFERFKNIFSNFNEIQRLIFGSQVMNNPEIKQIQDQLSDAKKAASRSNKPKDLAKIKALEKSFDSKLQSLTEINVFDDEFIYRIKLMLDTFSPNRLNFRLLPFEEFTDFQILASLKDKYLVDSNFENIIYTYGSRPNIRLTIFGIITSCPRENDIRVNPKDEFLIQEDEQDDIKVFDKALRGVFSSFEEFEKFFFVPTFPKIAISPIAIYREVKLKE